MKKTNRRTKTRPRRCPKCGAGQFRGVCSKCKYSDKTAYKNRREAKEFTFAAD